MITEKQKEYRLGLVRATRDDTLREQKRLIEQRISPYGNKWGKHTTYFTTWGVSCLTFGSATEQLGDYPLLCEHCKNETTRNDCKYVEGIESPYGFHHDYYCNHCDEWIRSDIEWREDVKTTAGTQMKIEEIEDSEDES
jgi:hypothetical protein